MKLSFNKNHLSYLYERLVSLNHTNMSKHLQVVGSAVDAVLQNVRREMQGENRHLLPFSIACWDSIPGGCMTVPGAFFCCVRP